MSNKSHKVGSKHKGKANRGSITIKDVQSQQPLPLSSRRVSMTKSPVTAGEEAFRYRFVLQEIRRSLIVGAITLAILFVLYFLLR